MSAASSVRPRARRLEVENLEDRCVPAVATTHYLQALYNNLLHRVPSSSELAGWAGAMAAGVTPGQVALAFTTSSEFRTDQIVADYNRLLSRSPSPQEVSGWLGQLQSGMTEQQMESAFLASNEFFSRFGNDTAAWVNGVYVNVLGRPADPTGTAVWSQVLLGGTSRQSVATAILQSPEGEGQTIASAYNLLLHRAPDAPSLGAWEAALNQGLSTEQMVATIASSPEYLARTTSFNLVE